MAVVLLISGLAPARKWPSDSFCLVHLDLTRSHRTAVNYLQILLRRNDAPDTHGTDAPEMAEWNQCSGPLPTQIELFSSKGVGTASALSVHEL